MRFCYEAAIKISVESVGESVISVYKKHNNKWRPISEDDIDDEDVHSDVPTHNI